MVLDGSVPDADIDADTDDVVDKEGEAEDEKDAGDITEEENVPR